MGFIFCFSPSWGRKLKSACSLVEVRYRVMEKLKPQWPLTKDSGACRWTPGLAYPPERVRRMLDYGEAQGRIGTPLPVMFWRIVSWAFHTVVTYNPLRLRVVNAQPRRIFTSCLGRACADLTYVDLAWLRECLSELHGFRLYSYPNGFRWP